MRRFDPPSWGLRTFRLRERREPAQVERVLPGRDCQLNSDQQQAYVSFQKAVKLNPDNKEAYYGIGYHLPFAGTLQVGRRSLPGGHSRRPRLCRGADLSRASVGESGSLERGHRRFRRPSVIHRIRRPIWRDFTWVKPSCMRVICRGRWRLGRCDDRHVSKRGSRDCAAGTGARRTTSRGSMSGPARPSRKLRRGCLFSALIQRRTFARASRARTSNPSL